MIIEAYKKYLIDRGIIKIKPNREAIDHKCYACIWCERKMCTNPSECIDHEHWESGFLVKMESEE